MVIADLVSVYECNRTQKPHSVIFLQYITGREKGTQLCGSQVTELVDSSELLTLPRRQYSR